MEYVHTVEYCSLIKKEHTANTTGTCDRVEGLKNITLSKKSPDTKEFTLPGSTYIKLENL